MLCLQICVVLYICLIPESESHWSYVWWPRRDVVYGHLVLPISAKLLLVLPGSLYFTATFRSCVSSCLSRCCMARNQCERSCRSILTLGWSMMQCSAYHTVDCLRCFENAQSANVSASFVVTRGKLFTNSRLLHANTMYLCKCVNLIQYCQSMICMIRYSVYISYRTNEKERSAVKCICFLLVRSCEFQLSRWMLHERSFLADHIVH